MFGKSPMLDAYNRDGTRFIGTTSEWGMMFEQDRTVAVTNFEGGFRVSTVFLSLDHNHDGSGPPLIFESMVFAPAGNEWDCYCERYATEAEAARGHKDLSERIRTYLDIGSIENLHTWTMI